MSTGDLPAGENSFREAVRLHLAGSPYGKKRLAKMHPSQS